jgi:hypothetical protein
MANPSTALQLIAQQDGRPNGVDCLGNIAGRIDSLKWAIAVENDALFRERLQK